MTDAVTAVRGAIRQRCLEGCLVSGRRRVTTAGGIDLDGTIHVLRGNLGRADAMLRAAASVGY